MASPTSKPTFGATIEPRLARSDDILRPPPMLDSPALTPTASNEDFHTDATLFEKPIPPHSPFYNHPPTSMEKVHSRAGSKTHINVFEKDLEAGQSTPLAVADQDNPFRSKVSVDCNKECKMWPSRQTLMQTHLAEKQRRRDGRCCGGFGQVQDYFHSRFDKRQRLWIKILIAVFIVGVAIALGVGISKAVGSGVWSSNGGTQPIGGN